MTLASASAPCSLIWSTNARSCAAISASWSLPSTGSRLNVCPLLREPSFIARTAHGTWTVAASACAKSMQGRSASTRNNGSEIAVLRWKKIGWNPVTAARDRSPCTAEFSSSVVKIAGCTSYVFMQRFAATAQKWRHHIHATASLARTGQPASLLYRKISGKPMRNAFQKYFRNEGCDRSNLYRTEACRQMHSV